MNSKVTKLRLMQLLQLAALKELLSFSEKNDIQVFVVAGTLLGAYRHKGFIPWDSDMDVAMLRKDYDKFISLYRSEESDYYLDCDETNVHCKTGFAKFRIKGTSIIEKGNRIMVGLSGIYIDIFPLDEYDIDTKIPKKLHRLMYQVVIRIKSFKNGKVFSSSRRRTIISILFMVPALIMTRRLIKQLQNKIISFGWKHNSSYVTNYNSKYGLKKQLFTIDTYLPVCNVYFEGLYLPAPRNSELWLRQIYGDYMELPANTQDQLNKYEVDFGSYGYLLNEPESVVKKMLDI